MSFFIVLIAIIFFIHLANRVARLEKHVKELTGQAPVQSPVTHTSSPVQPAFSESTYQPSTHSSTKVSPKPSVESAMYTWLTTDWLLKLGAFLLLLGMAWFVTYAFAENWIGPVGRITFGLLFGAGLLAFGEWRGTKSEVQGTIFMAVGAAVILLTTYAARTVYDFFTPLSATGVMLAAIVTMSISSVLRKSPNRAVLSLVLAALVPFLTSADESSTVGLLSYAFMIIAGSIWIVSFTKWRLLTVVALVIYWIYSLILLSSGTLSDLSLVRVFVFAFGLLFYATGLIAQLRVEKSSGKEYFVSLGNALIFVIWIYNVVPEHLLSIVISGVALLFFVGSYFAAKFSKQTSVIIEYLGVALALLAAAATFELDGPALTITYSIIVCVGIFLMLKINQKLQHAQALGFLLIPVFLHSYSVWESRKYTFNRGVEITTDYSTLFVWGLLATELFILGYLFYKESVAKQLKEAVTLSAVYLIGSIYLALFTLWKVLESSITDADTAHAIALVLCTIVGIGLYFISKVESHKKSMYTGASILGFVVIRLLFVEVWTMELFQRVIVFILIGILLMSTSFIKAKREEITT